MFTVKVVRASGAEDLYHSVNKVSRVNCEENHMGGPVGIGVWFECADGTTMFPMEGGNDTIYVMNENGKTVATYHL